MPSMTDPEVVELVEKRWQIAMRELAQDLVFERNGPFFRVSSRFYTYADFAFRTAEDYPDFG